MTFILLLQAWQNGPIWVRQRHAERLKSGYVNHKRLPVEVEEKGRYIERIRLGRFVTRQISQGVPEFIQKAETNTR